jgi:hypothetical protein
MLLNELGGSFGNALIAIVATYAAVPNFRLTERTGKIPNFHRSRA